MPLPTNFTWDPSDEKTYDYALNVVPFVDIRGGLFLRGEAMDHDDRGNGLYTAYRHDRSTDAYFVGSRPITGAEFRAL